MVMVQPKPQVAPPAKADTKADNAPTDEAAAAPPNPPPQGAQPSLVPPTEIKVEEMDTTEPAAASSGPSSTEQNGGAAPPEGAGAKQTGVIKPNVLTHVIEGFVIQEAPEPFPVGIPHQNRALNQAALSNHSVLCGYRWNALMCCMTSCLSTPATFLTMRPRIKKTQRVVCILLPPSCCASLCC